MRNVIFWLIVLFLFVGTVLCFPAPRSLATRLLRRIPVEVYLLVGGFALMNAILL
jgi:hypothetical protein